MTDMERYLNIIAFNIPWPANYGGIKLCTSAV